MTEFVTELAFHVVNLVIAINPVRIAVGGGMVRSWDRLRPGLEASIENIDRTIRAIRTAVFGLRPANAAASARRR